MFGAFVIVLLYLFGLYWCYVVIKRFPEDLKEIYETREWARTFAIVVIWIITVFIAIIIFKNILVGVPELISQIKGFF
ncbi:MAG: hypothetical protein ACYTE8_10275 [Planctomycetota bacterium]|jgi:hypothetical protein